MYLSGMMPNTDKSYQMDTFLFQNLYVGVNTLSMGQQEASISSNGVIFNSCLGVVTIDYPDVTGSKVIVVNF